MNLSQPDLDLLADYVGGALAGTPQEAEVRDRVANDLVWAAAHVEMSAALSEVSSALAGLDEDPGPMPDDVWAGLRSALADETPPVNEITAGMPTYPRQSGSPADNRPGGRPQRRRRRWAVPVLAAFVVLFALAVGIPALRHQSQDQAGSGAADTAAAPMFGPFEQVATGRDYNRDTLVLATDFGETRMYASSSVPAKTANSAPMPTASVPSNLTPLAGGGSSLADCLRAVSALVPGQVVGVDFARYLGDPALIVVIRTADDGRTVAVARPDCGKSGADLVLSQKVS
ncbi:hypothetical protein [Hamadaea tsunoensis]|uniref:hypothetical protein n=1 Tax=Hamadaea tsunoensis TaxID=53368 RepID=UPI000403C7DD|nr:hypothetical protein [Hamadaea tsunoensis]